MLVESIYQKKELDTPKYQLTYKTGYTRILLFSDQNLDKKLEKVQSDIVRRLPGGFDIEMDLSERDGQTPELNILLLNANDPQITFIDRNHYIIRGPCNEGDFIKSLPYVVYNLGEQIRQQELRIYTMHGASVSNSKSESVLILGDKGSGKTSLCMALGMYHDYRMVGNDLILIQDSSDDNKTFLNIIDGNKIFDVRTGVLTTFFSELVPKVGFQSGQTSYESKISFYPEDLNVPLEEKHTKMKGVVRINIHPANLQNTVTPYDISTTSPNEVLRLRENLGRYIRGQTTPLLIKDSEPKGVFPSIDTERLEQDRNVLIRRLLYSPFIYLSANNPADAATIVDSWLKHLN